MTNNEVSDFGFGGIWGIIMLLIVAGLFNGGFGFGNGNAATTSLDDEFIKRDIFNTNTAVLTTGNNITGSIDSAKYDLGTQLSQNKYDTALGIAGINQNILLGNQTAASNMASCCCELKQQASENTQKIIDTITQNRIADLTQELNLAQIVASNQTQSQTILNSLGRFVPYSSYNYPYYTGTTIQ